MPITIKVGDCREVLRAMDAESIHCAVTSPPYFNLRDYGAEGQIGLEATPQEFIAALVDVFREVRRVLKSDGSLWLNLGDSFSKNKQLIGIPWLVAFALQADGWILREDIVWSKPNAMPDSTKDRCTRSHEYVFHLTKSSRYYHDHEAIKEDAVSDHASGNGFKRGARKSYQNADGTARGNNEQWTDLGGKRNKRSVWTVPVRPFGDWHFAVFPPDLIEPCIKASCPKGGTVLDPFGGAGTTGLVADRLHRSAILIEVNPTTAQNASKRLADDCLLFADISLQSTVEAGNVGRNVGHSTHDPTHVSKREQPPPQATFSGMGSDVGRGHFDPAQH